MTVNATFVPSRLCSEESVHTTVSYIFQVLLWVHILQKGFFSRLLHCDTVMFLGVLVVHDPQRAHFSQ